MSASVAQMAEMGIGLVVWRNCCHQPPVYVPPEEIVAKFGPRTCEEAQRLVRCEVCGAHGRDGRIEVLPSTLDMSDLRQGLPAGTSERQVAARRAAR